MKLYYSRSTYSLSPHTVAHETVYSPGISAAGQRLGSSGKRNLGNPLGSWR